MSPKVSFDGFWELIERAPSANGRKLPPNGPMLQLNAARVAFKHHGVPPSVEAATSLRNYAEQFLADTAASFFKVDFRSLSSIDLITHPEVAAHLRNADAAREKEEWTLVVMECALANAFLTKVVEKVLPPIPLDWDDLVVSSVLGKTREKSIEETVATMRNFTLATALRVPLGDFLKFRTIIPSAVTFEGKPTLLPDIAKRSYSREEAEFVFRYLANFAVTLERMTAGVPISTGGLPLQ